MHIEKRYDFKKKLKQIHKKNVRDFSLKKNKNEVEINASFSIVMPKEKMPVVETAVCDFQNYMYLSMGIKINVGTEKENKNQIVLSINKDIGDASGYMGYRISFKKNKIFVEGYDDRGIMQGLYSLEEKMTMRKAPFIEKKTIERKSLFSPRFSQSPLGMYEFSDECFALMSHAGYDSIDLWIKGLNTTLTNKFLDMNDICDRAEKYGIDIYIDLFASHSKHPSEKDAKEFYEKMYGSIFSACPKLKGIILEGESTEFHSHDKNAGKAPRQANYIDNIPTGKVTPGWWPCCDYPEWVDLIGSIVKGHNKDAKIIFSTYNWGYAPEKDRIKLINNLPKDVYVLATFDMFEQSKYGKSVEDMVDYSLSFTGPGKYFISEATAVKKRGLNMLTIANTSGKTWDFGVIPFEPFPYQWIKRFNNMVKAHDDFALKGMIENIHYSFYPSFINELEKEAFFSNGENLEDYLEKIIVRDYGKENLLSIKKSFKILSDAIKHYPPTNEDQYGAFRIGPAYPFWINNPTFGLNPLPEGGKKPTENEPMFGNNMYFSCYTPDVAGRNSLPGVRIFDEIKELCVLKKMLDKGVKLLEKIKVKTYNLEKLINLVKFISCCAETTINYKRFYITTQRLSIVGNKRKAEKYINKIEGLLLKEKKNVESAIPLVRFDSSLGWEPSMEYMADEKCLKWKLRQLNFELENTVKKYRLSNSL